MNKELLSKIATAAEARGEKDIATTIRRAAGLVPQVEVVAVVQSDDGPMYEKDYEQYAERHKESLGEEGYVEIRDEEEEQKGKIKKEGPPVAPTKVEGDK